MARARLALVVFAVVVAVGLLTRGGGVTESLRAPGVGTAVASTAPDGTPVLVVAALDGSLRAFAAEVPLPAMIGALLGWCAQTQTLVAPHHGLTFDGGGRAVRGADGGRAALEADLRPTLQRYALQEAGGATAVDVLRVGAGQPLRIGGALERADSADVAVPPHAAACDDPDRHLGSNASLPQPGSQTLVRGTVRREPDGAAWFCLRPHSDGSCPQPTPVTAFAGYPAAEVATTLSGTLLADVDARGVIRRLALAPTVRWQGAGLAGTRRVTGRLAGVTPGGARVQLDAFGEPLPLDRDGSCARAGNVGPSFALAVGATVPANVGLARPYLPDAPDVTLVVDVATCAVLAIDEV